MKKVSRPIVRNFALAFLLVAIPLGVLIARGSSPEELVGTMIMAEDTEEFNLAAGEAAELQEKAIPLFLAVLKQHDIVKGSVLEYAKTNGSVYHLRELARRGIYSVDEVPVLLYVIEERQIYAPDTVGTAEILRIITGLDVGYSKEFAEQYKAEDEPERLRKIGIWREWYNNEIGITADDSEEESLAQ